MSAKKIVSYLILIISIVAFLFAAGTGYFIYQSYQTELEGEYDICIADELEMYYGESLQLSPYLMNPDGDLKSSEFEYSCDSPYIKIEENGTINVSGGTLPGKTTIHITNPETGAKKDVELNVICDLYNVLTLNSSFPGYTENNEAIMIFENDYDFAFKTQPVDSEIWEYFSLEVTDIYGVTKNKEDFFRFYFDKNIVTLSPIGLGNGILKLSVKCEEKKIDYAASISFSLRLPDENVTEDILEEKETALMGLSDIEALERLTIDEEVASFEGMSAFKSLNVIVLNTDSVVRIVPNELNHSITYRYPVKLYKEYMNSELLKSGYASGYPYVNSPDEFTVIYEDTDGNINIVPTTDSLVIPEDKEGYTFTGWENNHNIYWAVQQIKASGFTYGMYLKETWKEHQYIIYFRSAGKNNIYKNISTTYDYEESEIGSAMKVCYTAEISYDTTIKNLNIPFGYTLYGWTTEAIYKEDDKNILDSGMYFYEDETLVPENIKVFRTGDIISKLSSKNDDSVTLYAIWIHRGYKVYITYQNSESERIDTPNNVWNNGMVFKSNITVKSGNDLILPALEASYYDFMGYSYNDGGIENIELSKNPEDGCTYILEKENINFNKEINITTYWKNKDYTISFDGYGVIEETGYATSDKIMQSENLSVSYLDNYMEKLSIPERTGFDFKGWKIKFSVGDEDIYLTDSNNDNIILNLTDDASNFIINENNQNCICTNFTLVAQWERQSKKLSLFNDKDNSFSSTIIYYGQKIINSANSDGYVYHGWKVVYKDSDKDCVLFNVDEESATYFTLVDWNDIESLCKYIEYIWTPKYYKITFDSDLGITESNYYIAYGESFNSIIKGNPAYDPGKGIIRNYNETDDSFTDLKTETLPIVSKSGYYDCTSAYYISGENGKITYSIWTLNSSDDALPSKYETDAEPNLSVKWTAKEYEVSLYKNYDDINDGIQTAIETTKIEFNQKFNYTNITSEMKNRTGYTLKGWSFTASPENESEIFNPNEYKCTWTEDTFYDVYAIWEANTYSIIYEYGDNNIKLSNPAEAKYDAEPFEVTAPTREGYIFKGWGVSSETGYCGQEITSVNIPISKDKYGAGQDKYYFKNLSAENSVTLNANWEAQSYVVSFNYGTFGSINVTYDQPYGTLPTPSKVGYIFKGWSINGTSISSKTIVKITEDIELIAQWEAQSFVVNFNYGTFDSITVAYDQPYGDLPTPSKVGYIFKGWSINGTSISSETIVKITEDIKLIAQWEAIKYEIEYYGLYDEQKELQNPTEVSYDEIFAVKSPSRLGYTFAGWTIYDNSSNKQITTGECGETKNLGTKITSGTDYASGKAEYYFKNLAETTVVIRFEPNFIVESSNSSGGNCLLYGTKITLADGTSKSIENLEIGDKVLVWNFYTGAIDTDYIVSIPHQYEGSNYINVISLTLGNGETLNIAGEHDIFIQEYMNFVRVSEENFKSLIGMHTIDAEGNSIEILSAEVSYEKVQYLSPITAHHGNLYASGVLTLSNLTEPFFNLFTIEEDTKYDQKEIDELVAEYGLLGYEVFEDYVSEEIYDAYNGKYLSIALGMNLITMDEIIALIQNYKINGGTTE